MLNYNIKGTGVEISEELRGYVEKRLSHIDKFLQGDSAAHIDVELEHHMHREGEPNRAEFTVTTSSGMHRVERYGSTLHAAIDLASGELTHELGRNKKKRLHLVRRGAQKVKDYVRGWRTKI